MFNQLPHELNREIGKFLDYNSRIEFSRILEHKDDKFVRKVKSDAHNLVVKAQLIRKLMEDVNQNTRRKSTIRMTKLFRHLANTKDTCIFDAYNTLFINVAIDKARYFADTDIPDVNQKVVKALKYNALRLVKRLTNYAPKKHIPNYAKLVEII